MIYRHRSPKVYMLLLYKYPEWMEPEDITNPSETVLFISSSLSELIKYFYYWFNKEQDIKRKNVLYEVQQLLYEHQEIERNELKPQH